MDEISIAVSGNKIMNETKLILQERLRMKNPTAINLYIEFEQGDSLEKVSLKKYLSKILERFRLIIKGHIFRAEACLL